MAINKGRRISDESSRADRLRQGRKLGTELGKRWRDPARTPPESTRELNITRGNLF